MILSLTAIDLNTKQDYISKLCICLYSFLKHNARYIERVHVFSNNRKFNELIEAICVKFDVQLEYCEVELKIDTIPKVYKIDWVGSLLSYPHVEFSWNLHVFFED